MASVTKELNVTRRVLVRATHAVDDLMDRARRRLEHDDGRAASTVIDLTDSAAAPLHADADIEMPLDELLADEPGCRTCGLTGTVSKIAPARKALSAVSFGLAGNARTKAFRCAYCGDRW